MLCYNTAIRRNNDTQRKEVSHIDQEGLISKKELLERYGISYGALYRWKRKGLIPEEWFLKKATVTGQETFFPEQLVCGRVELILRQKDAVSLDELVRRLNNGPAETDHIDRLALIFGTEGDGLSHHTISRADLTVKIPMSHGVDSLNVAASSAVAFYSTAIR